MDMQDRVQRRLGIRRSFICGARAHTDELWFLIRSVRLMTNWQHKPLGAINATPRRTVRVLGIVQKIQRPILSIHTGFGAVLPLVRNDVPC